MLGEISHECSVSCTLLMHSVIEFSLRGFHFGINTVTFLTKLRCILEANLCRGILVLPLGSIISASLLSVNKLTVLFWMFEISWKTTVCTANSSLYILLVEHSGSDHNLRAIFSSGLQTYPTNALASVYMHKQSTFLMSMYFPGIEQRFFCQNRSLLLDSKES